MRFFKTAAMRRLFTAVALWGGLTFLCAHAQQTREVKPADWSPSIRLVIPDIKLCPGQTYDLPVYIEVDEPIQIRDFQVAFRFPDYAVVEPTGGVTNIHADLRSGSQSSYNEQAVKNLPDHVFTFSWIGNGRYFEPESGDILFRFVIRSHEAAEGVIDLVAGDKYPTADDYSHFVVMGAANKGTVFPSFDTAYARPAAPPEVRVLPDTTMCVNEAIRFWAEGGIRYEWEDISYVERPYAPAMTDTREQYPLFTPREPGYYTYRCKITDRSGCSGYDTVQCMVRNNTLNLDFIPDTMVDMNTPAILDAEFWGSPEAAYTLSWEPASLVETPVMTEKASSAKEHVRVENRSLPLSDAQWFKLHLEDAYCKLEMLQNVNVLGAEIGAEITMDPPLFCVESDKGESQEVQLNVRAHGGSGKYTYLWSVESLEAGAPPVFETPVNGANATLRFYTRCVVYVDVADFEARAVRRFSDTIRFMEATTATVEIVDLNSGSSCEQTEMRFAAKSVNGGENPRYDWFINSVEALRSHDSIFSTYQLKSGDRLHCVLTSDKQCVKNTTATSAVIYPNVVYPGYMTALPSFGSDEINAACGDSLSLGILHRHTGNRFRLRWYRNDAEVLSDRYVEHERMVDNESVMDYTTVARVGYHDFYRAVITESDRACLLDDSLVTIAMYPRLEPKRAAQAGSVYVDPSVASGVCAGSSFIAYTYDLRYLPSQFRLVWYVKKPGGAPVAKGYYATSDFADNAAYGRNLGASAEFAAADAYYRTQNWILKGFPVSLSTAVDAVAGDSVYYRLETKSVGCAPAVTVESQGIGIKIVSLVSETIVPRFVRDKAPTEYCEGTVVRFYPETPASENIRYTWFAGGEQISGVYPDRISGDTLTMVIYNGLEIRLRAYNAQKCLDPDIPRISEYVQKISGMYNGFMTVTLKDTMLCSEEPVALWAVGDPYKGHNRPSLKPTASVPDWLPEYEGKITVEWAESRADALAGRFIHTGLLFETAVDSARFGDRSGDLQKDQAVVGTQTFVVRLTTPNGCEGYDSVRVTVGYRRRPDLIMVPEPAFPWCEGVEGSYFKLDGKFWGENPEIFIRAGEAWYPINRPDSVPYEPALYKRGVPLQAALMSSMRTCDNVLDAYSEEMPLQLRGVTQAWLRPPGGVPQESLQPVVCAGSEMTLEGFGGTMEELQALSGMQLSVDEIVARLKDAYEYQWTDRETGAAVSATGILNTTPDKPKVYELRVQDTGHRCPAVTTSAVVKIAVETGVNLKFSDVKLGKEVPFSICEGSMATQLAWRAFPQHFSGKAYMGFSIMTAESDYKKARQSWIVKKEDTTLTAWFFPGDRLVYAYFHDTLACNGAPYVMDSLDLQNGRPISHTFRARPDTLLCQNAETRLHVVDAMQRTTDMPDGTPSLKAYLLAQGVPGVADLPDDGLAETGRLSPDAAMAYWWPQTGMVDVAEKTSLTPLVSPDDKVMYRVWAYNEYGCIQTDSVRVERFDGSNLDFKLTLQVSDTLLCDEDSLWFSLDRYGSSILTLFDSLVWKRTRVIGLNQEVTEVLAVNAKQLNVAVEHGDVVYVDGFVKGEGLCEAVDAAWYVSNKIVVKSYRRPALSLVQVESAACADSTLELRATADAAFVQWLRVDSPDKGYEVLERGPTDQKTAWAKVRTFRDFTARATAYDHPACVAFDSISVKVSQTLDTLHIVLADPQVVCDGDPVTIEVTDLRHVETWRWLINGAHMTFDDFDYEPVMSDFLLGKLKRFSGAFKAGDRIWAEGTTTARCVYNPLAMSDTVTIERGSSPVLTWLEPEAMTDGETARLLSGCTGDPLAVRLHLSQADSLYAVWYQDGVRTERSLILAGTDDAGRIYEMTEVYPSPVSGKMASGVLRLGAINEGCVMEDSLWLVGRVHDTLSVEAAASAASVCEGEEVHYGLLRHRHVDSVVWYVNDEPVFSGRLPAAVEYVYRPAAGDRVCAAVYNTTWPCVVNNGKRSNELRVEVLSGDLTAGPVEAILTASADSVCGAGAPTYTVSGRGFDSVYWYANGLLSAVTDLLGDVTSAPEVRTAAWKRVPRPAAEGADSVYAVAVRRERLCAVRDSNRTAAVSVYRREMPEVRIAPRDTAVTPGDELALQASGATAYVWWTDADDGIAGKEAAFTLTAADDTVLVYVMGYEPAYGPDSLAGGGRTPAPDAYGDFGCRAYDSVCVRPGEELPGASVIYVPNAVLRNSARPADRVFKVFGERIASVNMRIYNNGGDLIFEKTGDSPVWKPGDVTAGNYTYRLVITLESGEAVRKSGWISVLD